MKSSILAVLTLILLASTGWTQTKEPCPYFGIGGTYAIENFDTSEIADDTGIDFDYKDSPGINAQLGIRYKNIFSAGLNFDYLGEFRDNLESHISSEIKIFTMIPTLRLSGEAEKIKPYIQAGFGLMHAKQDVSVEIGNIGASDSESKSAACVSPGAGIEFFSTPNVALDIGCNYTLGLGDLDKIKYFDLFVGFRLYVFKK